MHPNACLRTTNILWSCWRRWNFRHLTLTNQGYESCLIWLLPQRNNMSFIICVVGYTQTLSKKPSTAQRVLHANQASKVGDQIINNLFQYTSISCCKLGIATQNEFKRTPYSNHITISRNKTHPVFTNDIPWMATQFIRASHGKLILNLREISKKLKQALKKNIQEDPDIHEFSSNCFIYL